MNKLIFSILLALSTSAYAHTEVLTILPAQNAVIHTLKAVNLTFSEPIDLHFSTFKVYPLAAKGNKTALNFAAETLSKTALNAKNDTLKRIDIIKTPENMLMAAKVSISLKPNLKVGNYVVMWRILSDDGHVITGQSVFSIK